MKLIALLAVLAAAAPAAQALMRPLADYEALFVAYKRQHGKHYASAEEEAYRLAVFAAKVDAVEAHNADSARPYKLAINEYSDVTEEEFAASKLMGGFTFNVTEYQASLRASSNVTVSLQALQALPSSIDWRSRGAVTPVKNQGSCGSCWAFGATGAMEGAVRISTGTLHNLSEQQLVDCAIANGCNGGMYTTAFQYVVSRGLCNSLSYPYRARVGTCAASSCRAVVRISGFRNVASNNEGALMTAVASQPVAVAIDANAIMNYGGGVFTGTCGTSLNHAVLAVGYGTANGVNYWLVKNSWGTGWGEGGYIRLVRGRGSTGQCGIAMMPSFPTA